MARGFDYILVIISFLPSHFRKKGGESLRGFVANPQVCPTFFGNDLGETVQVRCIAGGFK
jgi:hypothetical protein